MFREWVSDNLRYILLILAILAVAVLAFFGIRYISGRQTAEEPASEEESVSSLPEETEAASESTTEPVIGAEGRPLSDTPDADVSALVSEYYAALSAMDAERLRSTLDTLSDEDAAMLSESVPVSYSDIKTYVKPGADESSLLAFVYYHYLEDGSTQVYPGLASLFLTKNASGKYVIKTSELSAEESAYLEEASKDPDITALIAQVQTEYDSVSASYEASAGSEESASEEGAEPEEGSEEAAEEAAAEETSSSSGTSRITQDCNVRAGAGYNYNTLGVITAGTEVTIVGEKGVGWTHIQGGGFDGYVGTSFLE